MLLYSLRETGVVDDYYILLPYCLRCAFPSFLPSSLPSHTLCRPWLQSEVNLAAPLFLPFGFDYTIIYLCRPPTERLSFSATVCVCVCAPALLFWCFRGVLCAIQPWVKVDSFLYYCSTISWGKESTTLLGSLSIVLPYIIQEQQQQQLLILQLLLLLLLECCILY
jgi:hypothetical protein